MAGLESGAVGPTPEEVRALIDAAEQSRRPEYARAILVAATTGLRRAELCGFRRWRDLDLERGLMRVSTSDAVASWTVRTSPLNFMGHLAVPVSLGSWTFPWVAIVM